jgi:agmatine deiminase
MAWAVHSEWGKARNAVKRELSEVIQTIARYEPVRVLAPRGRELWEALREFARCPRIKVIEAPVDDIWMRDIAPTFAWRGSGHGQELVTIDWNFNGWGGTSERPARPGDRLARASSSVFGVPRVAVLCVVDGGAIVTDGRGTIITTRSCLLNPNRNPVRRGKNRQWMIETELGRLGARKVIWLEGDPCEPLTSGHTDGYVLFAPSGVVLVETHEDKLTEPPMWREHDIDLLEMAASADGGAFKVKRVHAPRRRYWASGADTFAPCYLNAYVANGAVIGGRFGDPQRDATAKTALAKAFPGREIVMLRINTIAEGGGGVHCLTQPMPANVENENDVG